MTYTRTARGRTLCVACGIALLGCRSDRDKPAPPPPGPWIDLTIDGAAPRTIRLDQAIPLSALVEPAPSTWLEVEASTRDGRSLELASPSTSYPGSELRLYVDRGRAALGVFPPVTADMPAEVAAIARQPIAALLSISSVQVHTKPSPVPPLTIEIAGNARAVTAEQLRALPTASAGSWRAQGWALADVVEAAAPGIEVHAIRVIGTQTVRVDAAALRDQSRVMLLKPTRRGSYVFRMWDNGAKTPANEVRDVTKLVVD